MQKGVAPDELAGAEQGVPVAARLGLLDKVQRRLQARRRAIEGVPVARADDEADLADAGAQHFFERDAQHGLGGAVMIHDGLKRQIPLVSASGGDDGLGDSHECSPQGTLPDSARNRWPPQPRTRPLHRGLPSRYS